VPLVEQLTARGLAAVGYPTFTVDVAGRTARGRAAHPSGVEGWVPSAVVNRP
jgi:hypothetical protein